MTMPVTGTTTDTSPMRVVEVGQRYGRTWAVRDCSFELRAGAVTALVGPNGAGKSTLMAAAAGLLRPTVGRIEVQGEVVTASPSHPDLGYLAQDKPLYRRYRVRDMLEIGRHLNARWDAAHADELADAAGLDRAQRVGTLSGGQRTRLALALVLARRPRVLLLDEPLADLDPLARLEVQQTLMTEVTDTGLTVLMSSHILGEIADLCEDLLVMVGGGIALAGEIDTVLAQHRVLVGPGVGPDGLGFLPEGSAVEVQRAARQTTVLVDRPVGPLPIGWSSGDPSLEEIVVAYLRRGGTAGAQPGANSAGNVGVAS
jgi:ABC-2 type transport system ATP-binding protein